MLSKNFAQLMDANSTFDGEKIFYPLIFFEIKVAQFAEKSYLCAIFFENEPKNVKISIAYLDFGGH